MECFLVATHHKILVYEYESFKQINEIDVDILKQLNYCIILNIKLCKSERFLAVLVGKKTLNKNVVVSNLIIYEQDELNCNYLLRYNRKLPNKLKDSCY